VALNRRQFLSQSLALPLALRIANAAELSCDVAVIGGGVGGFAAALAAVRSGMRVILTEETDWIGGQLTSQAVPPDEHPWIEQFGCTGSYREYRNAVRAYYRAHYPLTEAARANPVLNPGNGSVSRLTHEPRVSVAVLNGMLAPYIGSGKLTVLLQHVPEQADVPGDYIRAVLLRDLRGGTQRTIRAKYFVDATELGDLLPLTGTEFVTGVESQAQTGEEHAPAAANPHGTQSFTYCFAMDYLADQDHAIEKPAEYNKWRSYVPSLRPPWTGPLLSWTICDPRTLKPRNAYFDPNPGDAPREGLNLWLYRRIAERANFQPGIYESDITLVNWPQNDYSLGDLVNAAPKQKVALLNDAKQLSLSLLYWMQTEAPRPDGGAGRKGLRLREDIVDTEDGLGKAAYIRESRRIRAEFTILEQHVGTEMRKRALGQSQDELSAELFPDSVGIGCYRIDLHPSADGTNYIDISSWPFQIPLGALIPRRMENLIPACKNIGTTHITNGCYRLHPVEWNIGEAAGALAVHAMQTGHLPRAVRNNKKLLSDFQADLVRQGFELAWPKIHAV
jgi:hypothetical protein